MFAPWVAMISMIVTGRMPKTYHFGWDSYNKSIQVNAIASPDFNRWVTELVRLAWLIGLCAVSAEAALGADASSKDDLIEAAKKCNVLAVYDDGKRWECIDQKKKEPSAELPCWMGGPSLRNGMTTQTAMLKSLAVPRDLEAPVEDARKFFAIGDYRLLGVGGFGIGYPGLDENELLCVLGGNYVAGTSDVHEGKEHINLQNRVSAYATKYNLEMIHLYRESLSPH